MKYLLALLLSFYATVSIAQPSNNKYGKPLIVLTEADPWLLVIGSDSPTFALYENGQIIFKKKKGKIWKYFKVDKDKKDIKNIILELGISENLTKLPKYISASHSTDQPTTTLSINLDSLKQIDVYGQISNEQNESRKNTPSAFLDAYDKITKFSSDSPIEWLPENIEVLATRYSNSQGEPLQWPKHWSDINSTTSIRRGNDLFSIYLDKKYFQDFIKLLKGLKQKQAVLINGKKYSLSYRFPFPNLD